MRPDVEEFFCGISFDAYRLLGSHPAGPGRGWLFTLWAPHARRVQLLGDWNGWDLYSAAELTFCEDGLWRGRVPQAQLGQLYKYNIQGPDGSWQLRADPFAFAFEALPGTASRLAEPNYPFAAPLLRGARRDAPVLIYELHAASWHRHWDGRYYTGPELAKSLVPYLVEHHYTHVEFLPLAEYPFDGSWGYQGCGYFAPTQRIGGFAGFAALVDALHTAGIAVLMDFVPVHFAPDADRLACFDGAPLFESGPSDWGSLNFDLASPPVRSFLLSSAAFWLQVCRCDGLRVDAVASMLYLDYGRTHWRRNKNGGRENLEAVAFLQLLNATVHREKPGALMIAEESTAWPHVTGPEGLGFDLKWNMGWMNDLCHYLKMDPYFRQYHHKDVTFSLVYAFSERFVLPISHDEVVHMKGSLRGKMPGDEAMQLAGVKSFLAYMLAHPGCKLLFMGGELPQWKEWDFAGELDWSVLQDAAVSAAHGCIRALNRFYKNNPPLWENDTDWDGFSWLVPDDSSNNILVFLRRDRKGRELICAVNFSPVAREEYRFGVPKRAEYREVFNTDDVRWGGSGIVNENPIPVEAAPSHGRETSIRVRIPPLGAVYLQGRGAFKQKKGADHP